MQKEFASLKEKINEITNGKPVYYLANYGNWGDGLIRHGTLKFFDHIGLKYKELSIDKKDWILPFLRGGTVIYGGGGAWCSHWNHSENYVRKLKNRFKVLVLPSSYETPYSIDNTTFYRRDEFQSKENMPQADFCHDMAFFIGDDFYKGPCGKGVGYFLRTDDESAKQIEIPKTNLDLSKKGNYLTDAKGFFEEINKYEVIYTDRLHVSIAGYLLKKEVHLFAGSYFKNKAVYMSSMSHADNVHFHENYDLNQA
ncbi:hypothetical protein BTA51_10395 [Hahella sp. CCB-MM4]|uniref:polysaccharide pyruvyl transferase family protein n=1 Tax=Hahella sp. (strain CCB-MM4) TaxID=1926491 RepID=UPI000B9BE90D|nr:polysaccharide pyruvyl transferase family protein [Hahella sp. CCB-MM4]OZG73426.1 hypothetical protein BTA51_10395 [Hahella sp. CCB-MM4]